MQAPADRTAKRISAPRTATRASTPPTVRVLMQRAADRTARRL